MRTVFGAFAYGVAVVAASQITPHRPGPNPEVTDRVSVAAGFEDEIIITDTRDLGKIKLVFRQEKRDSLHSDINELKSNEGLMNILFGEFALVSFPSPINYIKSVLLSAEESENEYGHSVYGHLVECYEWESTFQIFAEFVVYQKSKGFSNPDSVPEICAYLWGVIPHVAGSIPVRPPPEEKEVRVLEGPERSLFGGIQVSRIVFFKDDTRFKAVLWFNKDKSPPCENLEQTLLTDSNVNSFKDSKFGDIPAYDGSAFPLDSYMWKDLWLIVGEPVYIVECFKSDDNQQFAKIYFHTVDKMKEFMGNNICAVFAAIVRRYQ